MTDQIAKGVIQHMGEELRITGYVPHAAARGINPNLDVPLITHVKDGLWQGGCMQGAELPHDFDYVLSLYPWEKYTLGSNTARSEVTMYDSLEQGFEQVDEWAEAVLGLLEAGKKVLVHCQAGLNRSGLLAATILVKQGMAPDDAIELLRKQRSPLVLCNESFENYVRALA